MNGNGAVAPQADAQESFERGEAMDGIETSGDITAIGTSSWWKKPARPDPEAPEAEKEIADVTERMIENANATSSAAPRVTGPASEVEDGVAPVVEKELPGEEDAVLLCRELGD